MTTDQITTPNRTLQQKLAHAMTMYEFYYRQFKNQRDLRDFKTCKFWAQVVNEYVIQIKLETA